MAHPCRGGAGHRSKPLLQSSRAASPAVLTGSFGGRRGAGRPVWLWAPSPPTLRGRGQEGRSEAAAHALLSVPLEGPTRRSLAEGQWVKSWLAWLGLRGTARTLVTPLTGTWPGAERTHREGAPESRACARVGLAEPRGETEASPGEPGAGLVPEAPCGSRPGGGAVIGRPGLAAAGRVRRWPLGPS